MEESSLEFELRVLRRETAVFADRGTIIIPDPRSVDWEGVGRE